MKTDYQKLADYFLSVGINYDTGDQGIQSWIIIDEEVWSENRVFSCTFYFVDGKFHSKLIS